MVCVTCLGSRLCISLRAVPGNEVQAVCGRPVPRPRRALRCSAAAWSLAATNALLPLDEGPCLTACGSTACQCDDKGGQLAPCCAMQCNTAAALQAGAW